MAVVWIPNRNLDDEVMVEAWSIVTPEIVMRMREPE